VKTKNIHKWVKIRTLSGMGGKFSEIVVSYLFLAFIMVVMGLTLLYIHRVPENTPY